MFLIHVTKKQSTAQTVKVIFRFMVDIDASRYVGYHLALTSKKILISSDWQKQ